LNEEGNGGHWYLLTGLLLGLIIGISVALVFFPVKFVDTAPFSLNDDDKDSLRGMVALAYQADGDLGRARIRLELLRDSDPVKVLQAQAQRVLAQGDSSDEAQALAHMADRLANATPLPSLTQATSTGAVTAAVSPSVSPKRGKALTSTPQVAGSTTPTPENTLEAVFTPTPSAAGTDAPQVTFTPRATMTPAADLNAAFGLDKKTQVCDPSQVNPLLQVEILDHLGKPVPGAQVNVVWDGGQDSFYSGLHPEVDAGYADFEMKPNVKYSLRVGESGETVNNLKAVKCTSTMGTDYWGGWSLRFSEP
jgi:hypothetical protein